MPRTHPRQKCKICDGHRDVVGDLSTRGKCVACREALMAANAYGLALHTGPFHEHWRRRHAAAVGAVLLDDLRQTG